LPNGGKLLDIPGADGIEFGTLGLYRLDQLFGSNGNAGGRRVHCLSNPCTFQINELVFGVTSTDVLFHVSVEEVNANLPPGSRLRRIAQHLVQQQNYYPLFPPNKSVNLDLKQQDGWKMPCRPDVLIVPSKLSPFCAPVLENTIVVNPGHLTKGTTGGTYAIMEVSPMSRESLDDAVDTVQLPHNVQERLQLEIKRI
jgi:DNA polymerase alpha subunit B